MTSARRAAIRKAQLASARKRRGRRKRRIATGVGIAGAGVIAVTMAAANGYGKRRRARMSASNVVQATMKPGLGKELDLPRWTIEQSMINMTADAKRKRLKPRIDYGRAGKTSREVQFQLESQNLRQQQAARKAAQAGKGKRGGGRVRVKSNTITDKVKRNRPGFNDRRRDDYSPIARNALYERDKDRISARNAANYSRKKQLKALQKLFSGGVVGNIRVNSSSAEWNAWLAGQKGQNG